MLDDMSSEALEGTGRLDNAEGKEAEAQRLIAYMSDRTQVDAGWTYLSILLKLPTESLSQ